MYYVNQKSFYNFFNSPILSISAVSADDSFNDLQDLVDNSEDTIELSDDYGFQSTDSKNGIVICDDNITIKGNNHILDGKDSSRIFDISNSEVYLENINFIDGNYEEGGSYFCRKFYNYCKKLYFCKQ